MVTLARGVSDLDGCETFVLSLFARLTAFWGIDKTLVPIKRLLACGPSKILVTVNTADAPVGKLQTCIGFHNVYVAPILTFANRHSRTLPESVSVCFCKRDQV